MWEITSKGPERVSSEGRRQSEMKKATFRWTYGAGMLLAGTEPRLKRKRESKSYLLFTIDMATSE